VAPAVRRAHWAPTELVVRVVPAAMPERPVTVAQAAPLAPAALVAIGLAPGITTAELGAGAGAVRLSAEILAHAASPGSVGLGFGWAKAEVAATAMQASKEPSPKERRGEFALT
jgi:hypothetical protein